MIEVIKDLPNEEYHKRKEVGKSDLDKINKSMAHYFAPRKDPTEKMEFGSAFHSMILEPNKFHDLYAKGPVEDKRSRKIWEEARAENPGKTLLKVKEWDALHKMKEETEKHPRFSAYFEKGEPEVSVFWDMQDVGCKCRPDWLINDGEYIIDLKTSADASEEGFPRAINNFRYHVQDAWYTVGVKRALGVSRPEFVFIVVENDEPYSIGIYVLNQASKDEGWQVADRNLRRYVDYYNKPEEERFSGYSPDAVEVSLPRYGFKETIY